MVTVHSAITPRGISDLGGFEDSSASAVKVVFSFTTFYCSELRPLAGVLKRFRDLTCGPGVGESERQVKSQRSKVKSQKCFESRCVLPFGLPWGQTDVVAHYVRARHTFDF